MDAHDHSLVDLVVGGDEHVATVLGALDAESVGGAVGESEKAALLLSSYFSCHGLVRVEDGVDDGGSAGGGEEGRAQAEHSAGGDLVLDDGKPTVAIIKPHVDELALSVVEHVDDGSRVLLGDPDLDLLYGFELLTALLLNDDGGGADLKFKALTVAWDGRREGR